MPMAAAARKLRLLRRLKPACAGHMVLNQRCFCCCVWTGPRSMMYWSRRLAASCAAAVHQFSAVTGCTHRNGVCMGPAQAGGVSSAIPVQLDWTWAALHCSLGPEHAQHRASTPWHCSVPHALVLVTNRDRSRPLRAPTGPHATCWGKVPWCFLCQPQEAGRP